MKNFKNLETQEYLQIFWRRKWYFLLTFVSVVSGVTVYAFRLQPIYKSETKIMVESAAVPEDYVRPVDRSTPQDRITKILVQIQSRTFLARIVEQYGLFGFGSGQGFRIEDAINTLRGALKVEAVVANTFTLSFSAADPGTARDVLKRATDALIQTNVAAHKNATIETDQFVDEQLRRAERDLAAQEEKIKEYKTSHLGELPEQSVANLNILTGLNTQLATVESLLDRAREQQKLLESRRLEQDRLSALTKNLLTDSIESKVVQPEIIATEPANSLEQLLTTRQAQLAQLGMRLRPGHPDYDALAREIRALEQKIADQSAARKPASAVTPLGPQANAGASEAVTKTVTEASALPMDIASADIRIEMDSIKDEIARHERNRGEILKQIKGVQGKLNLGPAIEQDLMALSREREVLQRRYNDLDTKKFNSQMAASLATDINNESYKILDEANLPDRPAFPNKTQIIFLGLGAGIFLGLAAAVGREYLDPTIGSEHEAARVLNLPVLICIPEIPAHARSGRRLLARKAS
jgi:polysaccharide biosynthesis transport protein